MTSPAQAEAQRAEAIAENLDRLLQHLPRLYLRSPSAEAKALALSLPERCQAVRLGVLLDGASDRTLGDAKDLEGRLRRLNVMSHGTRISAPAKAALVFGLHLAAALTIELHERAQLSQC